MRKTTSSRIFIGTAGWSIPRVSSHHFAEEGTHLQRYALTLPCTEINSSFYRSHQESTYGRWAASTPPSFRFAVKIPRTITHEQKLRKIKLPLKHFLEESAGLGDRRGPLLVQLPPSLAFESRIAKNFFALLRSWYEGAVVCEPRHVTWFSASASELLESYRIARVVADPPIVTGAERPGGWNKIIYFRLHGSPRKYWSSYSEPYIDSLAKTLTGLSGSADIWCIFDNTAGGAAIENALALHRRIYP